MSCSNFIPELWQCNLDRHMNDIRVYGHLVNRDYEGKIKSFGDRVHITLPPDVLDDVRPELLIDHCRYFNFMVMDIDSAQKNPKIIDNATKRIACSITSNVEEYLADTFVKACAQSNMLYDIDHAPVPTSDNAYDYLVDLSIVLSKNDVPMLGRWVILPPWYYLLLTKDERFVSNGNGLNQALSHNGAIGKAAGFAVYVSNNVPCYECKFYSILAGSSNVAAFATETVELYATQQNHGLTNIIKGLHVYGAKVLRPESLAMLTVAKN